MADLKDKLKDFKKGLVQLTKEFEDKQEEVNSNREQLLRLRKEKGSLEEELVKMTQNIFQSTETLESKLAELNALQEKKTNFISKSIESLSNYL